MEENESRRFSLTDFIIKAIIVIIFILFTVWLLKISTKDLSKSLNVLTDQVFSENLDKMKEVGKSYFTTERLPEKVGDVKTLTLQKMYDEHLILEVKDRNGKACSAKNSYVSIEKFDNEYQMKVYLECGSEKEYIVVIMGCYDYCDSDICEKREEEVKPVTPSKAVEYEYKLSKGGKWTDFGAWSEWSKTAVSNTDSRQVETKTVKENYTYDKPVTTTDYKEFNMSCPSGYSLSSDKKNCVKNVTKTVYENPNNCPAIDGYKLTQNGFNCNYTRTVGLTLSCPTISGYTLNGRNGSECVYTSTTTSNPVCDPKYGNGTYQSISNFTCYYKATESSQSCKRVSYVVPKVTYCGGVVCGSYDETHYKTVCTPITKTVTTSKSAYCKEGYTNINGICTKSSTTTKTATSSCPSGYEQVTGSCISKKSSTVSCPTGYEKTNDNTKCYKNITETLKENIVKTCPTGYEKTKDNTKCYKNTTTMTKVTESKDVTYYRYRVREYIGGSVDYKWSKSNTDKDLLNAGYVLTGKTR